MSRSKEYQRLLNARRWAEVKAFVWKRAGGLCEACRRNGYITQGRDCHHKIPVESANPDIPGEMERLAYNPDNVELLCIPCHIKAHVELRSHYQENVQANKQRARQRFLERNDPNYQTEQTQKD